MRRVVVFWTTSTISDEKSAAKFHYIKSVSGKVVGQSIAFRVVSIYLNAKGPTRIGSTCVAHTSPHSAAAVTSLRHSPAFGSLVGQWPEKGRRVGVARSNISNTSMLHDLRYDDGHLHDFIN